MTFWNWIELKYFFSPKFLIFIPNNTNSKIKNSKMGLNHIFLGHPVPRYLLYVYNKLRITTVQLYPYILNHCRCHNWCFQDHGIIKIWGEHGPVLRWNNFPSQFGIVVHVFGGKRQRLHQVFIQHQRALQCLCAEWFEGWL